MPDFSKSRPPTEELTFLDITQRLARIRAGRQAVHIHLSKLSQAYNRDDYLRIASESFASIVNGMEGHLFTLGNNDLVFIVKDATPTMLESAVARLRALFSQDPLTEARTEDGKSAFCTWFDLEKDYDALLTLAQEKLKEAENKRDIEENTPIVYKKKIHAIRPDLLAKLEQSLENVDVTNIARRQTVCTLLDDNEPLPLFEEIFVSLQDLENIVAPDIDLDANVWLFRYITKTLDRRVMLMLIRDGVSTTRPFSINLNVSTVLTPEFAKFENVIAPQLKGRLVIEFNKLDVFSDMGAFLFARDYLHEHGFRLCLDGLTHHTMLYYDRAKLGFDLIKLFWTPNALDMMPQSQITAIRNLVMNTGQAHTILCRCDDEKAIKLGQELGIVMFQGRHVDKLMSMPKVPKPHPRVRV